MFSKIVPAMAETVEYRFPNIPGICLTVKAATLDNKEHVAFSLEESKKTKHHKHDAGDISSLDWDSLRSQIEVIVLGGIVVSWSGVVTDDGEEPDCTPKMVMELFDFIAKDHFSQVVDFLTFVQNPKNFVADNEEKDTTALKN